MHHGVIKTNTTENSNTIIWKTNFYTLHNLVLKYPSTDKILAFNVLGIIEMHTDDKIIFVKGCCRT